jgi:hypothetical protein
MAILTKGRPNQASHWYTPDGRPAHHQPTKSGGGERPTRLYDAVKLGLIPSVTSILGVMDKPGLTKWKIEQAILAADRTPRQPEEPAEYWARRVQDAAFQQVEDAAELGSRIHAALECAMAGEPYDEAMQVHIASLIAWKESTGITFTEREKVLVNLAEGYAGCADALFTYGRKGIGILDYKTRKTRPGEIVTPYDGQGMQLAAYAAAFYGADALPRVLAANVYISTTEPGRFEVFKHPNLPELYEAFTHACALWRHLKQYDPRAAGKAAT